MRMVSRITIVREKMLNLFINSKLCAPTEGDGMEINMDIIKKKMQSVEDMEQKVNISASEQQKKFLEGVSERKEIKTQYVAKKQQASYDATSPYGDTLSISEMGKTTSSLKGSKLVNDTADGTVIWKGAGSNEQE